MQFSLRELRARQNWTQVEAAKKIGISPATYIKWEKDLSDVKAKNLIKISEVFCVPLHEIKLM